MVEDGLRSPPGGRPLVSRWSWVGWGLPSESLSERPGTLDEMTLPLSPTWVTFGRMVRGVTPSLQAAPPGVVPSGLGGKVPF